MNLTFKNGLYICTCAFEDRNIAHRAGFYWDSVHKQWVTKDIKAAMRLRQYADKEAKKELNRLLLVKTPWPHRLTWPKGLTPKNYQIEDVLFALSLNRCYLALDPGLGKTIEAAMIRWALSDHHAVYICPPFLVETVKYEFDKWCYGIPISIYPDSKISRKEVINELKGARNNPSVLFVDEAHRFKNENAQRSKALFREIASIFNRVVLLSGTPMPNRPLELFSVLSHFAPETIDFMNAFEYGRKYCGGYINDYGKWDFRGASNMAELGKRVKEVFMRRRKKKDVLKELPPITEELLILDGGLTKNVGALEASIIRNAGGEDKLSHIAENDQLATYLRELGKLKAPAAVKYLKEFLEDTEESILIFAIHREVIAILEKGLAKFKPIVISGKVPTSKRFDLVKKFQSDNTRKVFIGNIQASGVGFTLTKATRVIFVEFDWVPGNNEQARDRAHRIGQNEKVLVQYMVFKDSIDRKKIETVLRKNQNIKHI